MEKKTDSENRNSVIIASVVGVIGLVIGSVLSAIFSVNWIEAVVIIFIIIVIGILSWLTVGIIVSRFKQTEIEQTQKNNTDKYPICDKTNSICCLKAANYEGIIDSKTKAENRLYDKEDIYDKEKNGFEKRPWQDIWIFSETLATEVDSNNCAEPVLIANITNNDTRYKMFYLQDKDTENQINERKNFLINSLKKDSRNLLTFVPLSIEQGYIGRNTLPLLCGSILFGNDKDNDGNPVFKEGYLSMRENVNSKPIYYKLPRCMLNQYVIYFKNIANKYEKENINK